MEIVYSDAYAVDIGPHVFPTGKYARVLEQLLVRKLVAPAEIVEPQPASWDELALVLTPAYLDKVRHDRLSPLEIAQLELPASPAIVDWFRLMAGGTIIAARDALDADDARGAPGVVETGAERGSAGPAGAGGTRIGVRRWKVVVHIGGGFHHACPDHGEGFCMVNDVAVAIRALLHDRRVSRAAVVDCDVHQGNGTAITFAGDPAVFTFSMHQEHNYPGYKPKGSLDIGLDDGVGDEEYLRALETALPRVFAGAPEVVFYVAGADPFEEDLLGGLRLTREGLRLRDRMVFDAAHAARVPVVVTLAGGYAERLADTVAIHVATVEEALRAGRCG